MRKLLFALLILNALVIGAISIYNFSLILPDRLEGKKEIILIQKPDEETNLVFVKNLEQIASGQSTDLMYKQIKVSGIQSIEFIYYKTNNNPAFISLPVDGGSTLLSEGEYFTTTTTGTKGERRIFLLSLDAKYEIRRMEDIISLHLDKLAFYIDPAKSDDLLAAIKDEGYSVEKVEGGTTSSPISSYLYLVQAFFLLLLLLSSIMHTFSLGKEIAIKRLSGYTRKQLIWDTVTDNLLPFGGICLLTLFLCSVICNMTASGSLITFLSYSYMLYLYLFFAVFLVLFISTACLVIRNGNKAIKGQNILPELYTVILVTKIVFLFIGVICLNYTVIAFETSYNTYKAYNEIAQKTAGYVTLQTYGLVGSINSNTADYQDRFKKLYDITLETFDGIVISASQYNNLGGEVQKESDRFIEVNKNYLATNSIMDLQGNRITAGELPDDEFIVLVPSGLGVDEEFVRSKFEYWPSNPDTTFHIVYYASNTKIFSYDPTLASGNDEAIIDPYIVVYNDTMPKFYAANYISGGSYMLLTKTDNPYTEILPYIKEANLEDTVISCSFVRDNYAAQIAQSQKGMFVSSLALVITMMMIAALIIYECSAYFESQIKNVAVKRFSGYRFWQIYRLPLIVRCIYIPSLLAISWLMFKNVIPTIALELLDLTIFYLYAKNFERKNIVAIIKGDTK